MTELPSIFEVQLLIKSTAARSKPKRRKLLLAKCYGYECFARSPRRQRGPARSIKVNPVKKVQELCKEKQETARSLVKKGVLCKSKNFHRS